MQIGRQIGQYLFSYATDNVANGNAYPDGNSSTEVFQKLIDGGYVTDASIFYVEMPGKVRPDPAQKKLKPENVSWDVTAGVNSSSQGTVPLVFLTGWKVHYTPGGAAVPLIKPYPRWRWESGNDTEGMAVFYQGNNAMFIHVPSVSSSDGIIPNFVPTTFKPDGHTYRQLTPDGVLP